MDQYEKYVIGAYTVTFILITIMTLYITYSYQKHKSRDKQYNDDTNP